MTKSERMTKHPHSGYALRCGNPKHCSPFASSDFAHSDFIRRSSFVIRHSQGAFSLLEMAGVLAVMIILAAAMVPALIRQMDRIAGEQESAALKSLGDALQQSILRKRYVPSATDWATNIAVELGVDIANVTTNARRQPRFLLIDPALRIGDNSSGLPYDQAGRIFGSVVTNNSGVVIPPISPRLLLLSSISRTLPTNILSGTSTNFNAIWDWSETGSALPATSFTWTGWPNCEDLKVQRINLSSLFVRLILTTNISESGYYSINTTSTNYNVPSSQGRDGYFIQNTVLYLYVGRTNLDTQQLLTRDTSYVYEQNIWRSSLTGGSFLAGSLDLGSVVDKYLEAPENRNAMYTLTNNLHGNTNVSLTQQSVVVSNMIAYMKAYTNWAAAGFPNNSLKDTARSISDNMLIAVKGQYQKTGTDNYVPYPTACP